MTTIRFGLSATFPGLTQGQPWDSDWTTLSTGISWLDITLPAATDVSASSGNQVSMSFNSSSAGSADIPVNTFLDQYEADLITGIAFAHGLPLVNAVSVGSSVSASMSGPLVTEQDISLSTPWNSIKDIEVSNLSARNINVTGFVDTWINAPSDNNDRTITIDEVKRGIVALGGGDDTVRVNVASNEYTWSNHFIISAGNGNDTVAVRPETYAMLAHIAPPSPDETFNKKPQLTTVDITLGNGNDTVVLNEVSGTIHVGSGNDTIHIVDGNSTVWLGSGSETVTIGEPDLTNAAPWAYDTKPRTTDVYVGTGHADITTSDTHGAMTTLHFIHGETGGNTLATADAVYYGHFDPLNGTFAGTSDTAALTIDLSGYSPGSTARLIGMPSGPAALLQIHDAVSGSTDAVALYGNVAAMLTQPLHVVFT